MKPKIDYEYVDASWLRPVSPKELAAIQQYFQEHPDYLVKYQNAPIKLRSAITNCWLNLPPEQEEGFRLFLSALPAQFTMDEFWSLGRRYKKYAATPPAAYLLNFRAYPWDMDKKYNAVYSGCDLQRMSY